MQDKIIQEVRQVREEIARRNGYDVRRIAKDLKEQAARRETEIRIDLEQRKSKTSA